jgi:ubiquinone/menaquinone biosynthesis C-methylase UbiE
MRSPEGVLDFVRSQHVNDERAFYDGVYQADQPGAKKRPVRSVDTEWRNVWAPQNRLVLEALGNINGKRVLLLGNGHSTKEIYLLTQHPVGLIYSDLSPHAVANIRDQFDLSDYADRVAFAAIDAHELPLADESVDIVYGYAMVHHLPDIERFFAEVMRVLAPAGRCVFMDDAYAPLWHYAKQTVLRPLMKYSHKKSGISPEDYRFSMSGGFREKSLSKLIREIGGQPWFRRTAFLQYIWNRGSEKLLGRRACRATGNPAIAHTLRAVDDVFARLPFINKNLIRLVWGFDKAEMRR